MAGQTSLALGAGGGLLAACGSSGRQVSSARPSRGGTLTVGTLTGGSAETLNPGQVVEYAGFIRLYALFDGLVSLEPNQDNTGLVLAPSLATSWEPNGDASVWTLHLRPGVTWHDGTPFGADDVVYTMRLWGEPANGQSGIFTGIVDFKSLRPRGKLTVEVPLLTRVGDFPAWLGALPTTVMVKAGTPPKQFNTHPVGTGPFMFKSFTPARQSVFVRNPHYWRSGLPYVDQLIVDSSFTDETARNNALLAGQTQVSPMVPFDIAKSLKNSSSARLLQSHSATAEPIEMRIDRPPFDDVRVRQAMKLLVNRPALIADDLNGFGTVGNDLFGAGAPYFASDLHRAQDLEQAKSLLKAAGREGMTVPFQTADPYVNTATLFAEQAKAAGINVVVHQIPSSNFFTSAGGYLRRVLGQDTIFPSPSLSYVYGEVIAARGPYNGSHWGQTSGTQGAQRLLAQAVGETDPTKAADLWREVQLTQFNQGGYIVWTNEDAVDAVGTNVHGIRTTFVGNLNAATLYGAYVS